MKIESVLTPCSATSAQMPAHEWRRLRADRTLRQSSGHIDKRDGLRCLFQIAGNARPHLASSVAQLKNTSVPLSRSVTQSRRTNQLNTAAQTLFTPLTISTAPASAKPILREIQDSIGSIPMLMAIFANSPTALEGYRALEVAWENGSFLPRERHLILLTVSVENNSSYGTATDSMALEGNRQAAVAVASSIRNDIPLPNAKHNALVTIVKELVRARGYPRIETIQQFLTAGYRREQVMEVLIGIALNTISNYLARIWPMPIDDGITSEGH
jgi:alkylhydroperoxidase family enzyme